MIFERNTWEQMFLILFFVQRPGFVVISSFIGKIKCDTVWRLIITQLTSVIYDCNRNTLTIFKVKWFFMVGSIYAIPVETPFNATKENGP